MRRGATRFGRIRLVNPVVHRAHADSFLSEVAHELAVAPLADLLVGLLAEAHARLNATTSPTAIWDTPSCWIKSITLRAA
jgi:hypothetical protein